jgi:hypothetical protein
MGSVSHLNSTMDVILFVVDIMCYGDYIWMFVEEKI